jgi:hypothetical protein
MAGFGGYLDPGDREDDPYAPAQPLPVKPPPVAKPRALPRAVAQQRGFVGPPEELQVPGMPQSIKELDDLIRRQRAELAKPQQPAFTPEQAQQRQDQNEREYNAGLMLQLMNAPQAQQLGGTIFRQALAQRQPHITERGTTNQLTGEFTYNPAYLREKDEATVTGLETKRAQAMLDWEKARTAAGEAATRQQQHDETMAAARAAGSAGANDARAAAAEARKFSGEDRMRSAYDAITKDSREEWAAANKVHSTINGYAGRKLDPLAQQSLVVLLNKFLDPGSVVREGEFDRVVRSQGLLPMAENYLAKIQRGDILTPQSTQQIQYLASIYKQAAETSLRREAKNYIDVANQRGYNPEAVITDPRWRSAPGNATTSSSGAIDVGKTLGAAPSAPQVSALPRATGKGKTQTKQVDY